MNLAPATQISTGNSASQTRVSAHHRSTMDGVKRVMMVATLATLTAFIVPAQAAVIDAVQDKVNAIKNDTNTLKNKSSTIVSKVNDQLRETVDIKDALAPLFELRDRFDDLGFTPSELLNMMPAEEIQDLIADFQQETQEVHDRLGDPNLEAYRQEFLDVLRGISEIAAEGGEVEVSPLETLVEWAPPAVLVAIKIATESIFPTLQAEVLAMVNQSNALRDVGVFDLLRPQGTSASADPWQISPERKATILRATCQKADGIRPVMWKLTEYRLHLSTVKKYVKSSLVNIDSKKKTTNVGVHGYLHLRLTIGKKSSDATQLFLNKLEWHSEQMAIIAQMLNNARDLASPCPFL